MTPNERKSEPQPESSSALALRRVLEVEGVGCSLINSLARPLVDSPAFALLAPRIDDFISAAEDPEVTKKRGYIVFNWYTTTFVATFLRAAKLNDHADAIENAKTLEVRLGALNAAVNAALNAAWSAAYNAALNATWSAAWSAAVNAAYRAAYRAAYNATWSAAWNAAESAAYNAAWSAAGSATKEALRPVQDRVNVSLAHLILKLLDTKGEVR